MDSSIPSADCEMPPDERPVTSIRGSRCKSSSHAAFILSLPYETILQIVEILCIGSIEEEGRQKMDLLIKQLSSVCRIFRQAVINTPEFWTRVDNSYCFRDGFEDRIARSKNRPLTVHLTMRDEISKDGRYYDKIFAPILSFRDRWQDFRLKFETADWEIEEEDQLLVFPGLETLFVDFGQQSTFELFMKWKFPNVTNLELINGSGPSPGSFRHLTSFRLELNGEFADSDDHLFDDELYEYLMEFIATAPRLEQLHLRLAYCPERVRKERLQSPHFPNLKSFYLSNHDVRTIGDEWMHGSAHLCQILSMMTLPDIEDFHLCLYLVTEAELLNWLEEASSALESLSKVTWLTIIADFIFSVDSLRVLLSPFLTIRKLELDVACMSETLRKLEENLELNCLRSFVLCGTDNELQWDWACKSQITRDVAELVVSFAPIFPWISRVLLTTSFIVGAAKAVPYNELDFQTVFDALSSSGYSDVVQKLDSAAEDVVDAVTKGHKNVLDGVKKLSQEAEKKIGHYWKDGALREVIEQYGVSYELHKNPVFQEYQMRVTEPKLCDPGVQQYSGYLDVTDGKHLFFWFFESRTSPEDAPLILWLNGGPGCSSSTGLLFELGPCSIANEGHNVTYNPHSWNSNANIIFLDQPVNVGYSYSDDGSSVNNSPAAGEDVLAFLQLFLTRFPKYADAPFHIAGESYGGTYVPNFANIIYKHNKALEFSGKQDNVIKINLASVMIGNGMTNRYIQDASIPTYACEGPFPLYDDPEGPECTSLKRKVSTCQRMTDACLRFNSRFTCVPATLYCSVAFYSPIQQSGKNPYDMGWIETWMNDEENKKAVGANPAVEFASCNMQVNQAFTLQGDSMHNSALLLTDLINDGVRLLIYAGNADYMCNFIGNEAWVEEMDSKFRDEFAAFEAQPWITLDGGKLAGYVRTAGATELTAGNVTFVTVYDAGHMVPFDQPEAALDLVTRWIFDTPLVN
ncbi:hypothetical protein ACEPAH_1960 [Sanghuangporus vaninii]